MKLHTKLLMLFLLVSATVQSQDLIRSNLFFGGHRGGNGGISVAADFTMVASNFSAIWENLCKVSPSKNLLCRNIKDFKSLLDKDSSSYTTILAEQSTEAYDGNSREATNDGFNTIRVDKENWLKMQKSNDAEDDIRMIKLVIHEYFSILGLDTSDYYKPSNNVIGIILRKGILPDAITRSEGLPDLCSINLSSSDSNIEDSELDVLFDKGFSINSASEVSRYSLKIKRACFNESLGVLCTIYTELYDNLKAKTDHSNIYAKKSLFKSDSKLRKQILEHSLSEINACK